MKDMGNAEYVLGIKIHRDRNAGMLGLSQKAYIEKVLKTFGMEFCAPGEVPIAKGDIFSEDQCPKNAIERSQVDAKQYASVVGSLMYAMTCIRPDIGYAVGMLGRFQQNPGIAHWKALKKVLRYLQRTKEFMLVYKKSDSLEVVGYSDADYAGCQTSCKSTSGYIFLLAQGAISWRSSKQSITADSTFPPCMQS